MILEPIEPVRCRPIPMIHRIRIVGVNIAAHRACILRCAVTTPPAITHSAQFVHRGGTTVGQIRRTAMPNWLVAKIAGFPERHVRARVERSAEKSIANVDRTTHLARVTKTIRIVGRHGTGQAVVGIVCDGAFVHTEDELIVHLIVVENQSARFHN